MSLTSGFVVRFQKPSPTTLLYPSWDVMIWMDKQLDEFRWTLGSELMGNTLPRED